MPGQARRPRGALGSSGRCGDCPEGGVTISDDELAALLELTPVERLSQEKERPQQRHDDTPDADEKSFPPPTRPRLAERNKPSVTFRRLTDVLANVPPEPDWLWDGYLAAGAVTLL